MRSMVLLLPFPARAVTRMMCCRLSSNMDLDLFAETSDGFGRFDLKGVDRIALDRVD